MATKPTWSAPERKRRFSVAEIAKMSGTSAEFVSSQIADNTLPPADAKRQWVAAESVIPWLEKIRASGPPPAEPEPDASELAGNAQLGQILNEEQIQALMEMNVPYKVIKNAATLEKISKTLLAVTQQNERALKIQTDAGRLVDMKDIEVFLDRVFADWIAEIRGTESALEYKLSSETGVPVETVRTILQAASNHLITAGTGIAETTETRMDEFRREQADRSRRRVDGARRAAAH